MKALKKMFKANMQNLTSLWVKPEDCSASSLQQVAYVALLQSSSPFQLCALKLLNQAECYESFLPLLR